MKSSVEEISDRRERLAALLRREGYLSVGELSARFAISEATVRRDLNALEQQRRITRTYGGALTEYDSLFTPFYQRSTRNREAKGRIAQAAAGLIRRGQTVFLDAGSTIFALAEVIASQEIGPLSIVTNSLAVADACSSMEASEIHLLGGRLLPHQLVVAGGGTGLSLSAWRFDLSFLSAEALNTQGLWNSQDAISEFQRHVCGRSKRSVFCVDTSKFDKIGPSFLMPWELIGVVVSDANTSERGLLGPEAARAEWIEA